MCNMDISISQLLVNTALKSTMAIQYGCVIVHKNSVVATGYNYHTGNSTRKKQCIL